MYIETQHSIACIAMLFANSIASKLSNVIEKDMRNQNMIQSVFTCRFLVIELSGRPNMFSGTFFQKGKTGVCTTEGAMWESQRTFLHTQMAKFASSKAFQVLVSN